MSLINPPPPSSAGDTGDELGFSNILDVRGLNHEGHGQKRDPLSPPARVWDQREEQREETRATGDQQHKVLWRSSGELSPALHP